MKPTMKLPEMAGAAPAAGESPQSPAIVTARARPTVDMEMLSAISAASSQQVLRDHLEALTVGLGFTRFTALCIRSLKPNGAWFTPGATLGKHIANTPTDWEKQASNASLARLDPVMVHCRDSSLPLVWDQQTYTDRGLGEKWELQAPYGYRSGIVVAMHMPNGDHYCVGLDSEFRRPAPDGDLAELIGRIQLTTAFTYDVAFRLLMPPVEETEATKRHGLSNRELEVLQWVAAGKTAWEAGVILSISENTVNKHLASCIEKLNCVNRVQAVARAVNEGLIQL